LVSTSTIGVTSFTILTLFPAGASKSNPKAALALLTLLHPSIPTPNSKSPPCTFKSPATSRSPPIVPSPLVTIPPLIIISPSNVPPAAPESNPSSVLEPQQDMNTFKNLKTYFIKQLPL
jgi:hypothetical protein